MDYVYGFLAAVPIENKKRYIQHARDAAVVFKGYGASRLVECLGDDVPDGEITSFPMVVKCQEGETCIFWPIPITDSGNPAKVIG